MKVEVRFYCKKKQQKTILEKSYALSRHIVCLVIVISFVFYYCNVEVLFSHLHFYIPPHASGGVLCFHVGRPCVCPSVPPKYLRPHFVSV